MGAFLDGLLWRPYKGYKAYKEQDKGVDMEDLIKDLDDNWKITTGYCCKNK